MKTWKILKDGVEIQRINLDVELDETYLLTKVFAKMQINCIWYHPTQIKGKESDFGILLGDSSYLKAELVKEPKHKFQVGDFVESLEDTYYISGDFDVEKGKKCEVLKIYTYDHEFTYDMIIKSDGNYHSTHSKYFKLWDEPKEPALEEWFKAQNFGEEFVLSHTRNDIWVGYNYIDKNSEVYDSILRFPSNAFTLERQKRIIEKHIELYK
jgi:hypothetical protein